MPVRRMALFLVLLLSCLFVGTALADHNEDLHSSNIRLLSHYPFPFGTGLDMEGNILVAGSASTDVDQGGTYLFNVGNPEKPTLLSRSDCIGYQGNPSIYKKTVIQSHDSASRNQNCDPGAGTEGMRLIDASDLENPESFDMVELQHGTHTNHVYREAGLVYNSSYNLLNATDIDTFQIVDINDPSSPEVISYEFPGSDYKGRYPALENQSVVDPETMGCHETHTHHERGLLFCSGITETIIMDISDPRKPVILSIIHNPLINIHHGAHANHEGDILVIGDEWAGAAGGPTGCTVPETPVGALWFYDISDPTSPELISYWAPPDPMPTNGVCTAHDFDVFHDREWLVVAWYAHGLFVLDFSDPANVGLVARYRPEGANFWDAKAGKGYIYATGRFTDDTGGLYIFELDGYDRRHK